MRSRIVGLIALVVAAPVTPLHAQSDPVTTVFAQLQHAAAIITHEGYTVENLIVGSLAHSGRDSWAFTLTGAREYVFVGSCDEDCDDVDVVVRDASGNVVARDVLEDDRPVVRFTPSSTQRYSIQVEMASCTNEPCYFGLGIMKARARVTSTNGALLQPLPTPGKPQARIL